MTWRKQDMQYIEQAVSASGLEPTLVVALGVGEGAWAGVIGRTLGKPLALFPITPVVIPPYDEAVGVVSGADDSFFVDDDLVIEKHIQRETLLHHVQIARRTALAQAAEGIKRGYPLLPTVVRSEVLLGVCSKFSGKTCEWSMRLLRAKGPRGLGVITAESAIGPTLKQAGIIDQLILVGESPVVME